MARAIPKWVVFAAVIVLLVVILGVSIWLVPLAMLWDALTDARSQLEQAGVPGRLALAIVLIGGLPFILASMRLMSKKNLPFLDRAWPPTKFQAFLIVVVWAGGFSTLVWGLTREHVAGKYYCPMNLEVSERPGKCQRDDIEMRPMTPPVARVIRLMHQGKDITPRELTQLPPDGPFFDAKSPSDVPMATVFFGRDLDGLLRPYSYPGLNPLTGAALEPATLELVREWRTGRLVAIAREESTAVAGRRAAEELERQEQARKKAEERRQAVRQARAEELRVRTGYAGASFNELREMAPLEPDNAMLHYELGTRLAGEGDREGALRSFRQALRANPGFTAARTRIEELGGQP